ncbi:MAG TPA: hypothetical protein PKE51_01430 [Gemmatimonadaceae bacterium]|nr:hypothetical protein [Gemmatimonadaceae bacterium]
MNAASSRSKSVALAFLLGAFLTGGASGFAAGRSTASTNKKDGTVAREYTYSGLVQQLARELSLSPEQTATVDSILTWRKGRYDEIMLPLRPALDTARDSARTLIEGILDPAQREAFIELRNRMSAQSDSARSDTRER